MGCGVSVESTIKIIQPKHTVGFLNDIINEMYMNDCFYISLYSNDLIKPLRRIKNFLDINKEQLSKFKTDNSLPKNVKNDSFKLIELYSLYNDAKILYGNMQTYFNDYVDAYFSNLDNNHTLEGVCDINISNNNYCIDLYKCGIMDIINFENYINKIHRINNSSKRFNKDNLIKKLIKENNLYKTQKIINITLNMLWYSYFNDKYKNTFIVNIDDNMPDSIKKRRLSSFNITITECKKCESSYYSIKSSIKRKDRPNYNFSNLQSRKSFKNVFALKNSGSCGMATGANPVNNDLSII